MRQSIRNLYSELGVDEYYLNHSKTYINYHEKAISKIISKLENEYCIGNKILDLCCGNGEVTKYLHNKYVIGSDLYMYKIYTQNTLNKCYSYSFYDIANGKLKEQFDTIICSFALHLCQKSLLPKLLWELRNISNTLVVISPNKKPNCDNISGWLLVDEFEIDRVKTKIYK